MFNHALSKEMSTFLRIHYQNIKSGLANVFKSSISGINRELDLLNNLLANLPTFFNSFNIPGIYFSARSHSIHAKPLVNTSNGRCELGDLLVVIKYNPDPIILEAKSIIYQIKLSQTSSSRYCSIDQRQLSLLCDWPQFSFGGVTFNLTPKAIEFGSFMLEPRNPSPAINTFGRYFCYGKCPHAMMVRQLQNNRTVDLDYLPYTRPDANNFFSHLAFEIGEHHSNQPVQDMINALYRFVGLAPDPPGEFKDDYIEVEGDGFGVLEINVRHEKGSRV
jgi:hypothetical protein